MPQLEFKYKHIHQDKFTTTYKATIYEGDETTEDEVNMNSGALESVTRYRRTGVSKTVNKDFESKKTEADIYSDLQAEVITINAGKTPILEQT